MALSKTKTTQEILNSFGFATDSFKATIKNERLKKAHSSNLLAHIKKAEDKKTLALAEFCYNVLLLYIFLNNKGRVEIDAKNSEIAPGINLPTSLQEDIGPIVNYLENQGLKVRIVNIQSDLKNGPIVWYVQLQI